MDSAEELAKASDRLITLLVNCDLSGLHNADRYCVMRVQQEVKHALSEYESARAQPQAESQDAKDAARYRWLKRHCVSTWHQVDGVALVVPTPGGTESVDMDVDIAMEESAHD